MSTQYGAVITQLQQQLGGIAPDDGMGLRAALGAALRQVDSAMRTSLKRGGFVTFHASRLSVSLIGKVVKVNPKNASVAIVEPVAYAGQIWRVSPSLLSTCDAPNLPSVDTPRAAEIARALCSEERFGPDECEARYLTENAGTHLLFVSTPAHGYFVTVSSDGVGRVVGEEDCGIPDARVRQFFGIGRYAEELMPWVSGI